MFGLRTPRMHWGAPVFALIRRSALQKVGGWSVKHDGCADYHLWLKLALLGPPVVNQRVTAAHRVHGNSYGDRLRQTEIVNYYSRHIEASRDALLKLENTESNVLPYLKRLSAQESLLDLLRVLVMEKSGNFPDAVRKFNQNMSGELNTSVSLVWNTFLWFCKPYFLSNGLNRSANKVLDLIDQYPRNDSLLHRLLWKWALNHSPSFSLLKRYPWKTSIWSKILSRARYRGLSIVRELKSRT